MLGRAPRARRGRGAARRRARQGHVRRRDGARHASRCSARGSSSTATRDRTTAAVVRGKVKLAIGRRRRAAARRRAGRRRAAAARRRAGPRRGSRTSCRWAAQARQPRRARRRSRCATARCSRASRACAARPCGAEYAAADRRSSTVDVVVEDQVARVALDQTFHNPAAADARGRVPVRDPARRGAAAARDVRRRQADRVGGRRAHGARAGSTRSSCIAGVDPALLEWAGTGRLDAARVSAAAARRTSG